MGIEQCLTDSPATNLRWSVVGVSLTGIHAAAFMVLHEHVPWGTPPWTTDFAYKTHAVFAGSSRAPFSSHARVKRPTLADLGQEFIPPRPHPRSVYVSNMIVETATALAGQRLLRGERVSKQGDAFKRRRYGEDNQAYAG